MHLRADILIAARDKLQVEALQHLLRSISKETVYTATDSRKALEFLTHAQPSTILVAEGLKPIEAVAFIRAIRTEAKFPSRKAHIIYVAPKDMHPPAIAAGAHAGLALPISLSGMMEAMARIKSDDRPFIELECYAGPCRRTKRSGPGGGLKRRQADRDAAAAALRARFEGLRVTLATAAKAQAAEPAESAARELLMTAREMNDTAMTAALNGLLAGLAHMAPIDERMASLIEEFAAALQVLHRLPPCAERDILTDLVQTLAGRIDQRALMLKVG
jgi:CheY-like chemotaxis protein